ncbi:MAG: DegT/DnrJ/EryC1/StrS family aminotransferase [Immundisolibacter sp.]|uniref:DegT/DnrJ/EryC1/StrS family aminotransferase n=1 Tax=Immundisolibacter sp. TaxID=1934948 RepID=UPI0019A524AA|nr:DegT/DnrJ/EryC1/StrS family aminotransferase [Immundisolibacter sp.]MBC7163009.1 DegT/DnrJ/EryC1/StrS family aminotransferase [Immundisolibacter sp.]
MSDDCTILFSDPDISTAELAAVDAVLRSPNLGDGPQVAAFEAEFAAYLGRRHAVAVASGRIGLLLALRGLGIGPGDEVIASAYGWRETAHAIALAGATPRFVDVDYWSGTLAPDKVAAAVTPATRAILAANTLGHPAAWEPLRALADQHGLRLIEDSSEAIGSLYRGQPVGSFGDLAVFDFSQPAALCCGSGGMLVTDDADLAAMARRLRGRRPADRGNIVGSGVVPYAADLSEIQAALGRVQLERLPAILERRLQVEAYYREHVLSFEGIKPPYQAPEVDQVHWFLYVVHLGTRFSRSSRDAIVEDLRTEDVESHPYCQPLHRQRAYLPAGTAAIKLFVTEKLADRAVALPFHGHLTEEQVAFVVATMKDASVNVGAGAAIYL